MRIDLFTLKESLLKYLYCELLEYEKTSNHICTFYMQSVN